MKERPILFSGPMVRAILEGRKTQTRRVAKPVKHPDLGNVYTPGALVLEREPQHVIERCSPFGQPGDRLWVREAWRTDVLFDRTKPSEIPRSARILFEADHSNGCHLGGKLRPSMFMPRWASRILLEITGIKIERLQEISKEDSIAEGIKRSQRAISQSDAVPCFWDYLRDQPEYRNARSSYASLWESINGPGSWDANPWVWVVEFRRVE